MAPAVLIDELVSRQGLKMQNEAVIAKIQDEKLPDYNPILRPKRQTHQSPTHETRHF